MLNAPSTVTTINEYFIWAKTVLTDEQYQEELNMFKSEVAQASASNAKDMYGEQLDASNEAGSDYY
jgi:hypothetical protein